MYIELFLLDNLLMDMLILRLACALCGRPCKPLRVAAFAVAGACYAGLAQLYPCAGHWLNCMLCMALLSLAVPNGKSVRQYGRAVLFTLMSTFLVGGMLFALQYAFYGRIGALPVRCALVGGCAAAWLPRLLRGWKGEPIQKLCVAFGGVVYSLDAQWDTGNTLIEPVSGIPVIVADIPALTPYAKIPIPASTVYGKGMLYALKPDALTLDGVPVEAVLALSAQGLRCALIPPAIQL